MTSLDYLLEEATIKAIRLAGEIALEYDQTTFGPPHLLWAVLNEDVGILPIIQNLGADPSKIKKWAIDQIGKMPKDRRYVDTPSPDTIAKNVLKETQKLCLRYGNTEISPIDLLEALFTPDVGFTTDQLRRLPLALYEIIDWRNNNVGKHLSNKNGTIDSSNPANVTSSNADITILQKYCDNLNDLAQNGNIDPIIGRDSELRQLMEILGKRKSPNVLIVGEPGVGKTAMVEGLVLKIVEGTVPSLLSNATIYSLDVSGRLVAGAFKGEVEERLKSIIKAVKKSAQKIILFIDEIHILLDEKGPVGSGVVNLLKPELARGELTVIGATTQTEYQKYIEKDFAFDRRFSRLIIQEPSEGIAIKMLEGIAPKYEDYHKLKINKEAVATSVKLAKKYIRDKFLPASAIEILDFALSCAVQMNATSADIIATIEKEWEADKAEPKKYETQLRNQLSELLIGKLTEDEDNSLSLAEKLSNLKEWTAQPKEEILAEDIAAILAYKTGIPIGRMRSKEQDKLKNVETILKKRVVGQDHVIAAVARGLKAFRTNLKDPKEPGAIFFFTGPTGTGKTELAKAIAELLFDDEEALLRFDMSEFQESHSVATLLGAPPGYTGYDKGGILVNNIRKKPYSVVLFDEIEKAHADIYGIFLQMLTDSRLQDKQGKLADFSNTIIIFTSNAGAHKIVDSFQQGKQPTIEELKKLLRETKHFKDEFLGRVDTQILPFAPISEPVAKLILNIHYNKFVKLLKKQHNIDLTISEAITNHLIDIGFSPLYGARPLRNAIKSFLTPPIADKIIMGALNYGDILHLDIDTEKELVWHINNK